MAWVKWEKVYTKGGRGFGIENIQLFNDALLAK